MFSSLNCPMLQLFFTPAKTVNPLRMMSTVSATPVSCGSAVLTSVCRDFPLQMTLAVGHLGGESVQCPLELPISTLIPPTAAGRPSPGIDAIAHVPWQRKPLYTFPVVRIIPLQLERVGLKQLSIILVAANRCLAPFYAELTCSQPVLSHSLRFFFFP